MHLRKPYLLFIFTMLVMHARSQFPKGSIVRGTVDDMHIQVYLPPGYDKDQGYPILYVNDGQTAFGITGLNMDAIADEMVAKKMISPLIIVGIESDYRRTSYYIPYEDAGARQDFGDYTPQAGRYTKQIIGKLIPYIEKKYASSSKKGIAGYSFGGLHAVWAALNHPSVFSFAAGLSPSFWVNDFKIFTEASKAQRNQLYYFDMGTGEWNYYVPFIRQSKQTLLENIFYYEVKDAHHQVHDWIQRVPNILLLFAGDSSRSIYTWDIQKEVIKSPVSDRFYLRINPVITYQNGFTCSLSYAAVFHTENPEDGIVNPDGSFRFLRPKDLKVTVTYKGEERKIVLRYEEIENEKKRLLNR
jgi:predicted alpha/beta superfamily hydrolase